MSEANHSIPLLPSHRFSSSDAGPSRPMSRTNSAGSRRALSRNESRGGSDEDTKVAGSRRGTPTGIKRDSSDDNVKGRGQILFKNEDLEDDHSPSVPLLANDDRNADLTEDERAAVLEEEWDRPDDGSKGTLMESIANMANSIIGAGIVGLPYAIHQAGFVTGIFLLISLALLTDWTIRLVVVNAKLSGRDSYIGVMNHCFGAWGGASVSFFQFAFAFGGMCAFNVIIGDTIPHVIAFILPTTNHPLLAFLIDRRIVIFLATICVSFPLSLHRDIVKLSKSSGFALISMGVIVTAVVLRGVAVDPELRGQAKHVFSLIRPGISSAIGVISFAFVCHHNTMYIYKAIDTPTLDRFYAVTHASTMMSLIACLLMAVTGYVVFTNKTQGNILNNFSPDDTVINIARFCFGANMSTTIPLENYVCREVIDDYFYKDKPFSNTRHIVVTSLLIFSTMGIAMMTDDLGIILEIAGGMSATALAFIFPALAYAKMTGGHWYSRQKLPAVGCAIFGVIVLCLSIVTTLYKAVEGGIKEIHPPLPSSNSTSTLGI